MKINNKIVTDMTIANEFNKFVANLGPNVVNKI